MKMINYWNGSLQNEPEMQEVDEFEEEYEE